MCSLSFSSSSFHHWTVISLNWFVSLLLKSELSQQQSSLVDYQVNENLAINCTFVRCCKHCAKVRGSETRKCF